MAFFENWFGVREFIWLFLFYFKCHNYLHENYIHSFLQMFFLGGGYIFDDLHVLKLYIQQPIQRDNQKVWIQISKSYIYIYIYIYKQLN